MNDTPNPQWEKLIALLYGELGEAEERELRALMASDPALRAEWEELRSTRTVLGTWDVPERSPRIVFVHPQEPAVRGRKAGPGPSWHGRSWRDRLRGWLSAPAFGVALAGALVAVLALTHFRVERIDAGLAFRFGSGDKTLPALADRSPTVPDRTWVPSDRSGLPSGEGVGLGLVEGTIVPPALRPRASSLAQAARDTGPSGGEASGLYVTREELNRYFLAMGKSMLYAMDEYTRERDQSVAAFLQTALGGVNTRQIQDYRELRTRIEELGSGLLDEQSRTQAQLDYLLEQDLNGRPARLDRVPAETPGGER